MRDHDAVGVVGGVGCHRAAETAVDRLRPEIEEVARQVPADDAGRADEDDAVLGRRRLLVGGLELLDVVFPALRRPDLAVRHGRPRLLLSLLPRRLRLLRDQRHRPCREHHDRRRWPTIRRMIVGPYHPQMNRQSTITQLTMAHRDGSAKEVIVVPAAMVTILPVANHIRDRPGVDRRAEHVRHNSLPVSIGREDLPFSRAAEYDTAGGGEDARPGGRRVLELPSAITGRRIDRAQGAVAAGPEPQAAAKREVAGLVAGRRRDVCV